MLRVLQHLMAADQFSAGLIQRGLEKENLRLNQAGSLSSAPHPLSLGAKQTHPHITTDFAEAQMEIVSGVHNSVTELCAEFEGLYRFIHSRLSDETLWPYSMPCMTEPHEITPAYYGQNNTALMKQIYRQGLTLRYGKAMQIICGIHYNFSVAESMFVALKALDNNPLPLQDYISSRYMGLIRNYFRYYWILPYLFGASPLVMKSSLKETVPECLKAWDKQAYYAPFATSLRMTRIGYQNNAQSDLNICHNSIEAYARSLLAATQIPFPMFAELGLKNAAGQYQQLNTNILQIENEYYSPIRPKRVMMADERPAMALLNRGIQYVEVRVSDLNPLLPLGLSKEQLQFMDVFLLFCLLSDSPDFVKGEMHRHRQNFNLVAVQGRKTNLALQSESGMKSFSAWAEGLFQEMYQIAQALDQSNDQGYVAALTMQHEKLHKPELLPSQLIMQHLESSKLSLNAFMLEQANIHRAWFTRPIDFPINALYEQQVNDSIATWRSLEQSKSISFDEYLARYFSQGEIDDPHRLCY